MKKTLFSTLQTRIDHLSQIAFQKKYLPFTMILTFVLVLSYGVFFFQWLQGFSGQPQFVGGKGAQLELVPSTNSEPTQRITFQTKVSDIQNKSIDGVQFVAILDGDIPDDIHFVPAQIDGLQPLVATISEEDGETLLKIAFLTPPPNAYTITSPTLVLGTLEFTRPDSGKVEVEFNPYLAKMPENKTASNFLETPKTLTLKY